MAVDDERRSPFRDRIYVSWTRFAGDGTAYIFLASSRDYGESFSAPRLVSGDSALCDDDLGGPQPLGACSVNQFSQPFTGPDGTLYVTWANYNVAPASAGDNRAQMLLARSTDGGNTFSAPVKVGDFYDLPDCPTYQGGNGAGSGCVPDKGATTNSFFRAANYPVGAVDPLTTTKSSSPSAPISTGTRARATAACRRASRRRPRCRSTAGSRRPARATTTSS